MTYTSEDLANLFNEIEAESSDHLIKMAKELTESGREHISEKNFALPGERYPIHDRAHAQNALARVSQHGTPAERAAVRKKVYAKYPELKEKFEERHGESPTSKENVKKEEQGDIGKEASARALAGGALIGGGAALTGTGALALRAAHEQKKISKGEDVNPWASKLLRVKSLPPEIQKKSPKEQAEWYQKHHMQKKSELQIGQFKFAAKEGPSYKGPIEKEGAGPLTATLGEKGEAIGTAAGLLAGATLGAALGKKPGGARVIDGLLGGMLGTVAGATGGRVAGHVAEVVGRETEGGVYDMGKRREAARRRMKGTLLSDVMNKKGSDEQTYDLLAAVSTQMQREKEAQGIPKNIANSPETSPQEKARILALKQKMKTQKKVGAAACDTPGEKKRSKGKGKGLAYGKGKGPMGVPKKAGFVVGGVKIGAGEDAAADELGFSNATAEGVKNDQQSAAQDLIGAKVPTATSEHLQQVAAPPSSTNPLFHQRVADEIDKVSQFSRPPAYSPTRVVYYPVREPSMKERASAFMQEHPEAYPLIGAALGGTAGGLLGSQVDVPGATLAGTGVGAAGGAALGEVVGSRSRKKRASFVFGVDKTAAKDKPGNVSKEDLKRVFEASVRRSGSPVRRRFLWDVGDVVGKKKGKEEYKPGVMVQIPTMKRAQERPDNPMMGGGDVRYTAGPIPEDVAQYLRTQRTGRELGELLGLGAGAGIGGGLGYVGGGQLAQAIDNPLLAAALQASATGVGTLGGAYLGKQLGAPAGEAVGGAVAERTTPAGQITAPFLTPSRSEYIASRLAAAPMLEAGRTPTVAVSPA